MTPATPLECSRATSPPARWTPGHPVIRVFDSSHTRRVVHGPGSLDALPEQLDALGVRRPFFVLSNTLATETDLLERLRVGGFDPAGFFHNVGEHVPRDSVVAVTAACRDAGADGLVSVGGGSPIDCAKAAAMCLAAGGDDLGTLERQRVRVAADGQRDVPPLAGSPLPHVAVGTTLSGAEFTGILGVTDTQRGAKDLYVAAALTPTVALLDAALARRTPPRLWCTSGIRAIDHIVEGIYSPHHHPVADAVLLAALRILAADLLPSASDADDLDARERCQLAGWMAIMYLHNVSMGLSHGLGHQLGARFGVPHGVTSCVLLPAVMEFNRPVSAKRQALLAEPLGVRLGGMDDDTAARAAQAAVRAMIAATGVPARLRDVGVEPGHFHSLAEEALADPAIMGNPRSATLQDIVAVLRHAH